MPCHGLLMTKVVFDDPIQPNRMWIALMDVATTHEAPHSFACQTYTLQ